MHDIFRCLTFRTLALLFILLFPKTVFAVTDFELLTPNTEKYRQQLERFSKGKTLSEMIFGYADKHDAARYETLCRYVITDFLETEIGKVEFNHLFNQIKSEEHKQDIEKLEKNLNGTNDCISRFKLWLQHDDKWYFKSRKLEIEIRTKNNEKWKNQIIDRGAKYRDTIINGTAFSIPRKHIWFGSRERDSVDVAVNLRFHFPGLEDIPDQENPYGKRTDIAGVLSNIGVVRTYPCINFMDRKMCTQDASQTGFSRKFTTCNPHYFANVNDSRHLGLWRKKCVYTYKPPNEKRVYNAKPVFDDDVGMWRIGHEGYYEGSIEFPDYWFVCPKIPKSEDKTQENTRERCDSAFRVDENTYFYYSYPQRMFWEHRELQNALKQKIQSFIVETY